MATVCKKKIIQYLKIKKKNIKVTSSITIHISIHFCIMFWQSKGHNSYMIKLIIQYERTKHTFNSAIHTACDNKDHETFIFFSDNLLFNSYINPGVFNCIALKLHFKRMLHSKYNYRICCFSELKYMSPLHLSPETISMIIK